MMDEENSVSAAKKSKFRLINDKINGGLIFQLLSYQSLIGFRGSLLLIFTFWNFFLIMKIEYSYFWGMVFSRYYKKYGNPGKTPKTYNHYKQ